MDASSYSQFSTFFDNLNEAVGIYTSEKILFVNKAFIQLLGYDSPDDFLEKNILDFVHLDDLQRSTLGIMTRLESGKGTQGVVRFRKKDGTYLAVEGRGSIHQWLGLNAFISIYRKIEAQNDDDSAVKDMGYMNEIRSSLTVIQGYNELLTDDQYISENPKYDQWLQIINQNINKINEILTKIE
jgi:PAS domain S-box-containing protein